MKIFLAIWYIWLIVFFGVYTSIAYRQSLWSYNNAKPAAKRALLFLVLIILTIMAESYFK